MSFISFCVSILAVGLCLIWGAPVAITASAVLVGTVVTAFLAIVDA